MITLPKHSMRWKNERMCIAFWIFCLETVAIKSWATIVAALIIYIHQIDARWLGSPNCGITFKKHTRMNEGCAQMDPSPPNRFGNDESVRVPTCYVKLNLQCDFAGDAGVPQQLIGLL